jgi:hypothetical protein
MFPIPPHLRVSNFINNTLVGNPNLRLVLTIAQSQLRPTYRLQGFLVTHKLNQTGMQQKIYLGKVNVKPLCGRISTPVCFFQVDYSFGPARKKSP